MQSITNTEKVESYYSQFDEWKRLEEPEGKLEFDIVMSLLNRHIPKGSRVLDLGGGPGRYTVELSNLGYKMSLADLSPHLIEIAKEKIACQGKKRNIESIEVCNALDLSKYQNDSFDALLLFGPLYHLTSQDEILTCLSEVARLLKPKGLLFAIFIPWLSGLTGVLERSFYSPDHVNGKVLMNTFQKGIFNNASNCGFQEGSYIKTEDMLTYFSHCGFEKRLLRSIRGIGFKQAQWT